MIMIDELAGFVLWSRKWYCRS